MANTVTNLTAVLQMNNTKFKSGLAGSQKALTGFQKQVKALGGLMATTFAVTSVVAFGKSAFLALDKQRKAEASLLTALKGKVGIQQDLIQQAKELQKRTLFGDEDTIRAQALAASMGLTHEQIKVLIPAAQNLSAAMGQTLEFGVKNLARTFGGLSGELGEIMPALRNLTQEEMKAGKAIELVNELMGGQAEAAAKADTSLTQLKNRVGDFKEAMAGLIIEIGPATKDVVNALGDKNIGAWDKFLALFDPVKAAEIQAVAGAFDNVASGINKVDADELRKRADALKKIEEHAKLMSKLKAPNQFTGLNAEEEAWYMGGVGLKNMDWSMEPGVVEAFDELGAASRQLSANLDDHFLGSLQDINAEIKNETFPTIDKFSNQLKSLEQIGLQMGMSLAGYFEDFGELIGRAVRGVETDLASLAGSILRNLGWMMVSAGFAIIQEDPAAWKIGAALIAQGGLLQAGIGLAKGLFPQDQPTGVPNQQTSNVTFEISGKNLVGVMNNNQQYRSL